MAILGDKTTPVICQGFTGKNGALYSRQATARRAGLERIHSYT